MRWLVTIIAVYQVTYRIVSSHLSHCFFSCFYGCDFRTLSLLLLLYASEGKQKAPASLVWTRKAGAFICSVSSVSGDYSL